MSLESALASRRSRREFAPAALSLAEAAQLLWAAQGVTCPEQGLRTAPSAGALYPLETYLAAGVVAGLDPGLWRYEPLGHSLELAAPGDPRPQLSVAALGQRWVETAPASIVLAAVYGRTTVKYGDRGERYVHLDAGHAAQNVCLQAEALGLGAVVVGAFFDDVVATVLSLPPEVQVLLILPVGRPCA